MNRKRPVLKLVFVLLLVACMILMWGASRQGLLDKNRDVDRWLTTLSEPATLPSRGEVDWINLTTNEFDDLARQLAREKKLRLAKANEGIRSLGTNVLPLLLAKLQSRDSALASKLAGLSERLGLRTGDRVVRAARERQEAVNGFTALGPIAKPAIPMLIRLLNQPEIAESAYRVLARIDDDPVPWLLRTATNTYTSPEVRRQSLFALGNRENVDPRFLDVMLTAAKDPDPNVRSMAAGSLWRFPDRADTVVPVLAGLLGDPSDSVRALAAGSLGEFGSAARSTVPALEKALKSEAIQPAVRVALQKIAPEAASRVGVALDPGFEYSVPRGRESIRTNLMLMPGPDDAYFGR